jgi:hypothetical protein
MPSACKIASSSQPLWQKSSERPSRPSALTNSESGHRAPGTAQTTFPDQMAEQPIARRSRGRSRCWRRRARRFRRCAFSAQRRQRRQPQNPNQTAFADTPVRNAAGRKFLPDGMLGNTACENVFGHGHRQWQPVRVAQALDRTRRMSCAAFSAPKYASSRSQM